MNRLMSLCELHISKHVERATKDSIAKANVDIIGEVMHSLCAQEFVKWWLFSILNLTKGQGISGG